MKEDSFEQPRLTLRDHITGPVKFQKYRQNRLYYKVVNTGLVFTVPIEDCGDATFPAEDRAILFMRWIKQQY